MSKKPAPGAEVDAYCTRCKLDLSHRIVAMVGDTIKRVECRTCGGQHNYRAPKSTMPAAKKKRATRKKTAAATKQAAAVAVEQQRKQWEQAIMGRPADEFVTYAPAVVLAAGQLVRHKRFGDGVVTEVRVGDKVEILFEGGPRILIHNRG